MTRKIVLAANTDWYIYNFRKELSRSLIEQGWEVFVVTPHGQYVEELIKLGCSHIPWQVGRQSMNPLLEWASILKLRKIYSKLQPTLIHQHTLKSVIYGTLAARGSQIPIVNSIAGRGYVYSSSELKAKLIKPILDLLLRLSMGYPYQKVIFENQADLQYFLEKRFIQADTGILIQSVGVDLELFKPAPIPPFHEFTVGYVGRMLWTKGVGFFVDAARLLKKEDSAFKMALIGLPDPGNPESISAEQLAAWEQEGIIEWWGWQTNMADVYKKLHALAFPTTYGEGVPTVLLEAGASQRVLIATDTPGCREIIEDNKDGFLIPSNDARMLADKIIYISKNEPEYHRLRKNAYRKTAQFFSTDVVIERTLKEYDLLLQRKIQPDNNQK